MVYCRVLASIFTAGAGMLIAGVGNVYTGVSATREYWRGIGCNRSAVDCPNCCMLFARVVSLKNNPSRDDLDQHATAVSQ